MELTADSFCVHGYVRNHQQQNTIIIPEVIVAIILKFYEILMDEWDLKNYFDDDLISNHNRKIERNMLQRNYGWRNAYGIHTVSSMQKKKWTFRITKMAKASFFCYIGVVESDKILKNEELYAPTLDCDWGDTKYGHSLPMQSVSSFTSLKIGDIISMELDMTIDNGTKCKLIYFINNIFYKEYKKREMNCTKSYNMGISVHGTNGLEIIKDIDQ